MTVSGINMVFRIVHSRYSVRKWPHISIHGYAFEMMWVITAFGYLIRDSVCKHCVGKGLKMRF